MNSPVRRIFAQVILGAAALAQSLLWNGCVTDGGCTFTSDFLSVKGKVTDAASGAPIEGAAIGFRFFAEREAFLTLQPLTPGGRPSAPLTLSDGSFDHGFFFGPPPSCASEDNPLLPTPDQIEVIVHRDGCETSVVIDINENTVVDPDIPPPGTPRDGFTIEFLEPIAVPPCEANE